MRKIIILLFFYLCAICSDFDDFEAEFAKDDEIRVDKFESYNRFMTEFNYAIYNMSARPIVGIYETITPKPIRKDINNFFHNLSAPLRFITLFLSAEFKASGKEFMAFIGNTTFGLGGIFRPFKYEKKSDFGLMLARWGVPPGEHIVLPFFGPSNIRDAFALPFDLALEPSFYLKNNASIMSTAMKTIDKTSKYSPLINEAYQGINPYITIRDFYEKSREENK